MPMQAAFHNQVMNITEPVSQFVIFDCTSCEWTGTVKELALINNFSCCPKCNEFDVRVQNSMVNF